MKVINKERKKRNQIEVLLRKVSKRIRKLTKVQENLVNLVGELNNRLSTVEEVFESEIIKATDIGGVE